LASARSSIIGEMSTAVTWAPWRRAISMAVVATPQPTSSTRLDEVMPARASRDAVGARPPGWMTRLPITAMNLYGSSAAMSSAAGLVITVPSDPCPPDEAIGTVVDVRQRNEFSSGHVPGAISMELGDTAEQASTLPGGPLTVMCGHGERAMSAASILAAEGRTDVSVLLGGPADVVAARHQHLAV